MGEFIFFHLPIHRDWAQAAKFWWTILPQAIYSAENERGKSAHCGAIIPQPPVSHCFGIQLSASLSMATLLLSQSPGWGWQGYFQKELEEKSQRLTITLVLLPVYCESNDRCLLGAWGPRASLLKNLTHLQRATVPLNNGFSLKNMPP